MATVFFQEEMILRKAEEILGNGEIETQKDKLLYENLLQEYNNLLIQMKRVIRISDKIGGQLSSVLHSIDEMAKIDYLTNLYNRRYFDELLDREWGNAIKIGSHLSVLMMDVDRFKCYNDTYGHLEGDKTLQKITQAMQEALKEKFSFIARYGGEEFVVLLPDTNFEEAKAFGDKVRLAVKNLNIIIDKEKSNESVTISVGIASNEDKSIKCAKDLIDCADKALYCAKELGKNRVYVWNSNLGEHE